MKIQKKILCITGTRADYPRIKSVLKRIKNSKKLKLYLLVTGAHLLKKYGNSIEEIKRDGFKIDAKVKMYKKEYNTPHGMLKSFSHCTSGIADVLKKLKPDLVLLTVDRVETLAAATACSLMNFPIAHVQGGELTGTIDESIRHAITKLSQIHFPSNKDAANRIIKMGENPKMVYEVGCPYIDVIKSSKLISKKILSKKYKFNPNKKIIIFTQHPVTTEYGKSIYQIKISINALKQFSECEIIAFYSNTDSGGKEIIKHIKSQKNFKIIPNMLSIDFLSLMSCADLMIGNSSAAIREAPSFNLRAINIGSRQQGRLRAKNIIDVNHNEKEIVAAINRGLKSKNKLYNIKNPYGNGDSSKKIVDILEKIRLNQISIQKEMTY